MNCLKTKKENILSISTYDRRHGRRENLEKGSFYCYRQGERIQLIVVERSSNGVRVLLPTNLAKQKELFLTCELSDGKFNADYRIVWKNDLIGGMTVAGLECMLSTELKAA